MLLCRHFHKSAGACRNLVGFITNAFNEIDYERLECVGPERLCAEWVLKNGGRVRLSDHKPPAPMQPKSAVSAEDCIERTEKSTISQALAIGCCPPQIDTIFFADYNHLPSESESVRVAEIDATGSSITARGCLHLRDCQHVERIILDSCQSLHNDGLKRMHFVSESLRILQISNCPEIGEIGLRHLAGLKRLQALICYRLKAVRDMQAVEQYLRPQLPGDCETMLIPWDK